MPLDLLVEQNSTKFAKGLLMFHFKSIIHNFYPFVLDKHRARIHISKPTKDFFIDFTILRNFGENKFLNDVILITFSNGAFEFCSYGLRFFFIP